MRRLALASSAAVMLVAVTARADDPRPAPRGAPASAPYEDAKTQARAKYLEGVKLVQKAQWSDALAAFEASSKLYPNPTTTLNMGACERALGRYVQARATLMRAVDEDAAAGHTLPESSLVEVRGFLAEIERLLAHVTVTVDPPEAAVAVDGRPLAPQPANGGARPLLAAGVMPPGPGTAPPAATFDLVTDPGAHVITLSRKGFTDAVVNRTLAPGVNPAVELHAALLPATLKVTSSEAGAIVRVNEDDVGPTPVDVLRPAGSYRVNVKKDKFVPYSTQVTVQPGEEIKLRATLLEEKPSIVERWWFWTGAAAVIAGGVVVTYFATKPKPEPPPYDGGSTGWIVKPTGFKF